MRALNPDLEKKILIGALRVRDFILLDLNGLVVELRPGQQVDALAPLGAHAVASFGDALERCEIRAIQRALPIRVIFNCLKAGDRSALVEAEVLEKYAP